MISRRTLLFGAISCSCCAPSLASEKRRLGCFVRRAHNEGSQEGAEIYKGSTGVPQYDRVVTAALSRLTRLIGRDLNASLRFMDGYDAHYNTKVKVLAFGKTLLDDLRGSDFEMKVNCIAAHEICHSFQVPDPYMDLEINEKTIRKSELMADTFAGFILAMLVCGGRRIDNDVIIRRKASLEGVFRLFFSWGESNANDPHYHGSPEDRSEAVRSAYEYAFQGLRALPRNGDIAYDLLDLARLGGKKS
jgi:hypothetical protein